MSLSRFVLLRSSYSSIDWTLTFDLFKDTLYHRLDVASISSFHRYRLQLWFDELPLMFRLRFHYPGLYADDSLCPNCGIPFGIDCWNSWIDFLIVLPGKLLSGLPRRAASQIILRQFLKLHTSPVTLSLTNESLSPLQASEWSSLGIFWTHSAIIRGTNWLNNLSDFLKSRTVLVRFKHSNVKDRLISLLLQLPGRQNLLIIGAYIPPASGLNNKLIAECHFTFVNWITSARATGVHIMLGGDLNANFDSFIKNISNDDIRSPLHSLFRFLHTHQFDDLCALDPSTSLPLPTFTSVSSGQLSRLDYLWTSPDFLATHLWSHVMDTLDTFNSDHMLLIGFFDFLSIRDMRAHSYLKQRSRYRTVYNFHTALPDQKALFTSEVDVDRVLVTDIPGSLQLLIAPDDIHAAAIKHFQNVVGSARSPFKSLNELPERWKNRYTPISEINPDIYQLVMAPIDNSELRAVINDSPSWKAPGPSSIPYEWFKLLSTDGISYLCQLMNSCLVLADIPEDWRLASIVPIPKPHEFECLLKNTCPITLLETARKLLVKIITARLSKVMATQHVLTGDNFAGLSGSSVTTPINVLDGIMKSHCISSQSQELWILSQDISKAFDSIDLSMLKLRIDQGEIISPLLWTIYFDPLLTELSATAPAPYIWSSGLSENILSINNNEDIAVPITQLTYIDDSTLLKYELVSSKLGNTLVTFNLTSEISNHLPPLSFSLQTLKLSTSFRFLGVWFNLQGSPNFVLLQVKDIYSNFVASVRFKKLSSSQLAYLHSSIIMPKVQFRSQVLYLSESQIMRIANGYYSLQRKALSLARTFPTIALTSRFFNKDVTPYDSLCERLICRFLAWMSFISTGSKYANWVLITLRTLQGTLKWPSSLDSIDDFSIWTFKRRSISHNWLLQTIKLIKRIGLQFDFPDNTFLELMPNESHPLVSLSSSGN
ncbi:unnamed protein product [Rhizophagus irregularis]|nr:unnamed protein product [Rhizophagus irregularis]